MRTKPANDFRGVAILSMTTTPETTPVMEEDTKIDLEVSSTKTLLFNVQVYA